MYYNTIKNFKTSNIQDHISTINFHCNSEKTKGKTLTTIVDGVLARQKQINGEVRLLTGLDMGLDQQTTLSFVYSLGMST